WEAANAAEFGTEREARFINDSGVELKRVYTPLDLAERGFDYSADLGLPGAFPYTRGITSTMYRSQPWKIRQYAGFSKARETNRLFKTLIAQGQNALSLAF